MPFKIKFLGLKEAEHFFRTAPRKFERAMGVYTNNQAYDMQSKYILMSLNTFFTVRDRRFVQAAIRFTKARLSGKPPYLAFVGSIERDRFSGWAEQEAGKRTKRKRTIQMPARRRNWKRKASPKYRYKPSNEFLSLPLDVSGTRGRKGVIAALRILSRKRHRDPFRIEKRQHPNIKGGLYRFTGRAQKNGFRDIEMLQSDRRRQPKRRAWMMGAIQNYDRMLSTNREWGRALKFVFGPWKRKNR